MPEVRSKPEIPDGRAREQRDPQLRQVGRRRGYAGVALPPRFSTSDAGQRADHDFLSPTLTTRDGAFMEPRVRNKVKGPSALALCLTTRTYVRASATLAGARGPARPPSSTRAT